MAKTTSEGRSTGPQKAHATSLVFVGIGASAGAMHPLERLFSLMPADSGMVFVVVQHLERHHPSLLAELLAKHTQMPVHQAEDGVHPLANHVYIIPPNALLTLEQGLLRVARPTEEGVHTPIDAFLRSQALELSECAIGIILSGTGSDGTAGLRAIKDQGGLTLAQSPETAKYDSMPQSAIAAGLVDLTLPVEEMPAPILTHAQRVATVQRKAVQDLDEEVSFKRERMDLSITADLPIIDQLESELRTTRVDLQSAMHALELANKELQSANDELHSKVLELDATNADLQHHYTGTHIATIFLDRELRILRCTPAASKLFNVRESDVGRPIRDLAPRFVEEDLLSDMAMVLRTETGIERQVHRDEGPAWFLVRIQPYHSQGKTVTGIGITFVDITDLSRAEEAAHRYGDLLHLSHDAIFVWRLDGTIEAWNRGAEDLYGIATEQACGQPPQQLLKTVFPLSFSSVTTRLREIGHWEGELEQQTRAGRQITVSSKLLLLRGKDGVDRVLESNRDITASKVAAAEREQLIEALREADQRKDAFMSMLSHELRNPLAPIWNSVSVLERTPAGGEQAQRAKTVIKRQIAQLTRIVDDLLDVTRVSQGKMQVNRRLIEIGALVQNTVEDHRLTFVNAGLELQMRPAERPLWIDGDPARLGQAIGNLLTNAAKFTSQGGHVLVVLEEATASGMAVLRIRDDGAGIDPDLLAHLFEPFEQADRSLDRSQGGLGLGLALVKGLIEQHGGKVRASSDGIGRGAEFTIRLPLVKAPSAGTSTTASEPLRSTRRILVIEDNVDAADSLREALMLSQHEVAVAYHGADGLNKARTFKPDVVLCDIGLPGMDGYQVAQAMRADDELCKARLIALTGYTMPQDIARAKEAGFDQHLAKPPSIEMIEEILEQTYPNS